jgi:uncharacterized protein YfiM (DUF2279 family)
MFKTLLVFTILSFAKLFAFADLSQTDKQDHMKVSAFFSFVANQLEYNITDHTPLRRNIDSFLIGITPGIVKEVMDSQEKGNKFDVEDLEADVIGVVTGMILSEAFTDVIVTVRKNKVLIFKTFRF